MKENTKKIIVFITVLLSIFAIFIIAKDIQNEQEQMKDIRHTLSLNEYLINDEIEQQLKDSRQTLSLNEHSANEKNNVLPANSKEFDEMYLNLKAKEYANGKYTGLYKDNEILVNDISSYNSDNKTETIYKDKRVWKIEGTLKIFKVVKTNKGIDVYYGAMEKPIYIEKNTDNVLNDFAKDFGQYSGAYDGKNTIDVQFEKIYSN